MEILRNESDLTPEMLEKVKVWVSGLTWKDFHDAGDRIEKAKVREQKQLRTVQTITDILQFGDAFNDLVIRVGELFIIDSQHDPEYLCIAKLSKYRKKHHTVLHRIAKTKDFEYYCSGYFAVPFLK